MRFAKQTKLVSVRKPTPAEEKRGADVAFERIDSSGRKHTILACSCYESWEQWGDIHDILADNVSAVEQWRHNGLDAFDEDYPS